MVYKIHLPLALSGIHDVFHISTLRKHVLDPLHIVHFEPLQILEDLKYEEMLVQILDRREQQLRTKTIPLVKVLWRNHNVEEVSWELEPDLRNKYHHLF
jgi:hypothetical protein